MTTYKIIREGVTEIEWATDDLLMGMDSSYSCDIFFVNGNAEYIVFGELSQHDIDLLTSMGGVQI